MLSILFTVSLLPRGHYIAYKLDNQEQVCGGDMAEWLKQAGSTLSPSMCLISSPQVADEERVVDTNLEPLTFYSFLSHI